MWARWFEQASRDRSRIIAHDKNERRSPEEPEILVSTVFLGLDHNFGDGPPHLWETMILGGPLDQYQERYSSREAALEGHARACERVRLLRRWTPPEARFSLAPVSSPTGPQRVFNPPRVLPF